MNKQASNNEQISAKSLHRRRVLTALTYLFLKRSKRYLPPVIRAIAGIILVCMGILGFLPVLGFWMIPLGVALIATDLPPLGRWVKRRLWESRRRHLQLR